MALTHVPNNVNRKIVLAGTEATRGAGATPDHRWPGVLEITKKRPVNRAPEATGTRDRLVTPNHGLPEYNGTYAENLTFQRLSQLCRYWIVSGDPAMGDSASGTEAFTRDHVPGETLDSVALQHGFPGLGWESVGVLLNEGTISIDFDDQDGVWKFSSTLLPQSLDPLPGTESYTLTTAAASLLTVSGAAWTVDGLIGAWVTITSGAAYGQQRQIIDNDATTLTPSAAFNPAPAISDTFRVEGLFEAGIAVETGYPKITTPGTKVYLDPAGGTLGATQIRGRMISANVTLENAFGPKWFLENEGSPSDKVDEGDRIVHGQMQMEFDRRDEYEQYAALDEIAIRIEKQGGVIDASEGSHYLARLDVARAYWTDYTPGTRQNNITATFAFDAYVPTAADLFTVRTVTPLATLY